MNDSRPLAERWDFLQSYNSPITPGWLSGFMDAEACFYYQMTETNPNSLVQAMSVEIKQSTHDIAILERIRDF